MRADGVCACACARTMPRLPSPHSRTRTQRISGELKALECTATIGNLAPGGQYRVTVVPYNHIGETCVGANANVTVRTDTQGSWR